MCGVGSGSHNHPLNFPRVFGCVGREELVEVNLILHFYLGLGQARDAGLAQCYVNNLPLPSLLCSLHLTCRIYLLLLSPLSSPPCCVLTVDASLSVSQLPVNVKSTPPVQWTEHTTPSQVNQMFQNIFPIS